MEEPDTGIVAFEPECGATAPRNLSCIPTDWIRLSLNYRRIESWVVGGVICCTAYDLVFVAM